MITDLILQIPLFFAQGFIAILPNSSGLPTAIETSITTFVNYAKAVSWVFPIETLFQALLVILAVDAGVLAWQGLNWIIKKIPGMS